MNSPVTSHSQVPGAPPAQPAGPPKPPPRPRSAHPNQLRRGVSLDVVIYGIDFQPHARARFRKRMDYLALSTPGDDVVVTNTTYNNENQLTASINVSSTASGSGDVIVTNQDGQSGTIENAYTILP